MHTTDGGLTWNLGVSTVDLESVYFINKDTGWSVGYGGYVYRSVDGANTWMQQTSPVTSNLSSVYFINDTTGMIAGDSGIVLKTVNSGLNWHILNTNSSVNLNDIHIIDDSTGFVAGDSGIILYLNPYGNWITQSSGTIQNLNSIVFVDSFQGWVGGDSGIILHTTDAGSSWIKQRSGTNNNINSIYFVNSEKGWAVGDGCFVLHTHTGGSSFVEENNSSIDFSVLHISPNPFSSQAQIQFVLNHSEYISLNIYNIVGQKVKEFNKIYGQVGINTVYWDGKDNNDEFLPNGLYFINILKNQIDLNTIERIIILR